MLWGAGECLGGGVHLRWGLTSCIKGPISLQRNKNGTKEWRQKVGKVREEHSNVAPNDLFVEQEMMELTFA